MMMFFIFFGPSAFSGTAEILDHLNVWDSWNTVDVQEINALQKRFSGAPAGLDLPQFLKRCGDVELDASSSQRYLVLLDNPRNLEAEMGILRTDRAAFVGMEFMCADSTIWRIYDAIGGYYLSNPADQ